ncbi:MAG: SIR2 family protein [Cryomorphaceae bacterium]|nr:SIR2 family protein [Cryomorphaceae bacterium]
MLTNENHKGRTVILFGAGGTLSWNSPKTNELTELVRKSGFKTTDNKTTITEYLFQSLLKNGYSEDDINFETIINLIEELIVYYSCFDNEKKLPSLQSCLLSPNFENEIFNFSVKGGEVKHGYKLQIPLGIDYEYSDYAYNNETPKQFFLLHLLNKILTNISSEISEYAYHTHGDSVIDMSSSVSMQFCEWMTTLSKRNTLRLYTLNYDRLFKILLERSGLSLFEGFDCEEIIPLDKNISANVPKILSDKNCNCHYNLHGSAYWEVLGLDKNQLPNPEIVLTPFINYQVNGSPASFQIEKGKTLLVTNIITGYQKVQKANITPYRQMHSAFDNDCCFADEIFIIGYSFGDEHINQCLKTAIRYNPKLKITIIDPYFIKNEMDSQFAIKFFPYRQTGDLKPIKIEENLYSYFDDAFVVYTKGFDEFLNTVTKV